MTPEEFDSETATLVSTDKVVIEKRIDQIDHPSAGRYDAVFLSIQLKAIPQSRSEALHPLTDDSGLRASISHFLELANELEWMTDKEVKATFEHGSDAVPQ